MGNIADDIDEKCGGASHWWGTDGSRPDGLPQISKLEIPPRIYLIESQQIILPKDILNSFWHCVFSLKKQKNPAGKGDVATLNDYVKCSKMSRITLMLKNYDFSVVQLDGVLQQYPQNFDLHEQYKTLLGDLEDSQLLQNTDDEDVVNFLEQLCIRVKSSPKSAKGNFLTNSQIETVLATTKGTFKSWNLVYKRYNITIELEMSTLISTVHMLDEEDSDVITDVLEVREITQKRQNLYKKN